MEVNSSVNDNSKNDGLVFFDKGVWEFGLEELFGSEAEVLGRGIFGSTFKTSLKGGDVVVAVKRLKNSCALKRENIEGLRGMVHENLIPLIAYHYSECDILLLCDYMSMGSLCALLHGNGCTSKAALTWAVRTKIAYGVACGIEYLHSQGPNNCHGNIGSSNVLLTSSYDALVSDYGIANYVSPETKFSLVAGYRAPEAIDSSKVSQKTDVYSFGVLLLELLTGKDPIDDKKKGDGLAKWVRLMFQEKPIVDLFDNKLQRNKKNEEQMIQILQLAICCTFEYVNKRPSMGMVKSRIKEVCGFGS